MYNHYNFFRKFLYDAIDTKPDPCGLCRTQVLPAIRNLRKKNNSKTDEDTDSGPEDFSLLYDTIFRPFFNISKHEFKRPRLENSNPGGYAI